MPSLFRWVREDTTHNTTRDGLTYETAWGGFSEVVWTQLTPDSQLNMCGTHLISASVSTGAFTANSQGRVTIAGDAVANDPGVFQIVTAGNIYFTNARSWLTVRGISFIANTGSAIYIQAVRGNEYINCSFTGNNINAGSVVNIDSGGGSHHRDLAFRNCTFTGSASRIVRWTPSDLVNASTLTNITFESCTFVDCTTQRAILAFFTNSAGGGFNPGTRMENIKVQKCKFIRCKGFCLEISDVDSGYGHSAGLEVTDCEFTDSYFDALTGQLGGAVNATGFAKYNGQYNLIARNKMTNIGGGGGAVDIFFGAFLVERNVINGVYTNTGNIDGNGILLDTGCDDCIVRYNEINYCRGESNINDGNSGAAILFLQATNIQVYSNKGRGSRIGVSYGNPLLIRRPPISSITVSGTLVTVTTQRPHEIKAGDSVIMASQVPSAFTGTYLVSIVSPTVFTYNLSASQGANPTTLGTFTPITGQSSVVWNNTFLDNTFANVNFGARVLYPELHTLANNVLTGAPGAYIGFKFATAAWTKERNNVFHGSSLPDPNGRFVVSAQSRFTDPMIYADTFAPKGKSPLIKSGELINPLARDYNGRKFRSTPTIGCVEVLDRNV
jgi:hypothetical protein